MKSFIRLNFVVAAILSLIALIRDPGLVTAALFLVVSPFQATITLNRRVQ